jgi:hypothetical protein
MYMVAAILIGVAIPLTMTCGVLLAGSRAQEAAWRRIAHERRTRWEQFEEDDAQELEYL